MVLLLPWAIALAYSPSRAPLAPPCVRRAPPPVLAAGDDARPALSWQEEVESLLNPQTKGADRSVLLRDLLSRAPEVAKDVTDAVGAGDLGALVPPDSESQAALEGIGAVTRQLSDDVLPSVSELLADPGRLTEALQGWAAEAPAMAGQATAAATKVAATLLDDPARAAELGLQEARNTVARTPEGYERRSCRTLQHIASAEGGASADVEVREYTASTVAAVPMGAAAAAASDPLAVARALGALTAYLLGDNGSAEVMPLVAPFMITVDGGGGGGGEPRCEMAVALPAQYSGPGGAAAPTPSDGSGISLRAEPSVRLAALPFSGLATAGEVARRRAELSRALAGAAGVDAVGEGGGEAVGEAGKYSAGKYSVLLYNPPYTLPFLRVNEVAVAVRLEGEEQPATAPSVVEEEEEEQEGWVEGDEDLAPSD